MRSIRYIAEIRDVGDCADPAEAHTPRDRAEDERQRERERDDEGRDVIGRQHFVRQCQA